MNDVEQPGELKPSLPESPGQKSWNQQVQHFAIIMWSSFGAAAFASMICFSFIDPELLGVALMPEREISVLTGYGMGFFFFWFIALLSSGTTMFLRRSRRQDGRNRPDGSHK
jgi:hypothetical protein